MIEARYRRDYIGEFVILETRLIDGIKKEQREWIDNPIKQDRISNRAAVICSRYDQKRFKHQRLERHRGGLLGSKRLQTYASGDIWTDMRLDFYVTGDKKILSEIVKLGYDESSVVYSGTAGVLAHPGHFYLVPYTPYLSNLATALYLASFDGHEEIFLIGCNVDVPFDDKNTNIDMLEVMRAYSGTKYISVGASTGHPSTWLELPNFSTIPLREFISYCDI